MVLIILDSINILLKVWQTYYLHFQRWSLFWTQYSFLFFYNISMTEEDLNDPATFDPSKFNLRNKGIRTNAGKIHKGCVKDAFTKLSIGSIPSNY